MLGLWGYCSLIYSEDGLCASSVDLMPVTAAAGEKKKKSSFRCVRKKCQSTSGWADSPR